MTSHKKRQEFEEWDVSSILDMTTRIRVGAGLETPKAIMKERIAKC